MFKDHDPLAVMCSAMQSVVGWALVLLTTMLAGIWLGILIETGKAASPWEVGMAAATFTFAWLVMPQIALGYLATLLAWCLPLKIDSARLRLAAAVGHFLAWMSITIWVCNFRW